MAAKQFDFKTASAVDITKAIKSIALRANGVVQDIQAVGLACIKQVAEHRNVTPINDLYQALADANGMRATAFALWAQQFGGVVINPNKKDRKKLPLVLGGLDGYDTKPDLAKAMATPWYKVKTEPTLGEAIDSQKAISGLLARLVKADSVTDPELVKRLVAAFPELAVGKKKGATKNPTQISAPIPVMPALPNQASMIQ